MCVGPFGFPMRLLERDLQVSNPKFEIVAALQVVQRETWANLHLVYLSAL